MITRGSSKLNPNKRKELMLGLCRGLSVLKSPSEAAEVLIDLLTPKEIETIAKRLQIAEMLIGGNDYQAIRSELKVGFSTIARVNTWLNLAGSGYKLIFSRRKKSPAKVSDEEKYDSYSWYNVKRRYTAYFWPQLLLEELIKKSDKNEKNKIFKILDSLNIKKNSLLSRYSVR